VVIVDKSRKGQLAQLAKRIRAARVGSHLSQSVLAKAVGVSDKAISSYEKGRAVPSIGKLTKIAAKTGRSLAYFAGENTNSEEIADKIAKVEKELAQIKKLLKKNPK